MNSIYDGAIIRTVIAEPLLGRLRANPAAVHRVILDLNVDFAGGRQAVFERARELVVQAANELSGPPEHGLLERKSLGSRRYLYAKLEGTAIQRIVELDAESRAVFRIWLDFEIRALLEYSRATVKADAAQRSFSALGEGIVWAVLDSGIDATHLHFKRRRNLDVPMPLRHMDFTGDEPLALAVPYDASGHGTHVAGILAGEYEGIGARAPLTVQRRRDKDGEVRHVTGRGRAMVGMAPRAKLLSLRVLDDSGSGNVSSVLAALDYIESVNDHGRRLLIHGVNLSVGYEFEPEWFACGQTPLCAQVNRVVRTGVVVVAAAGNSGGGFTPSINDPGNADLAITVGATHAEMPHVYGISYFSSKGPTGDGRAKPDLVAPGENVLSCRGSNADVPLADLPGDAPIYVERSGTSMAAPHVSGAIAAFLSVRREYIGQPEAVKKIFTASATDLAREKHFQGHGLLDLMRAIQSV